MTKLKSSELTNTIILQKRKKSSRSCSGVEGVVDEGMTFNCVILCLNLMKKREKETFAAFAECDATMMNCDVSADLRLQLVYMFVFCRYASEH